MTMNEQQALEVIAPERGISPSSSSAPGQITETLRRAMAQGHLVSPANSCPELPQGCAVAVSTVLVDVGRETYSVAGGVALTKAALNRIAKAVGVSWDPRQSHRTDRGDVPNFASYKAVGHFRDFDGTWRTIEGEKQMDLTEGSERAKTMKPGELSEARKFVAEHAQTKAQLRAIRSLGIRSSYTKEELDKPFVCARLIFTGQSDDPETRKVFAEATAKAMLGGSEMLFGTADTKRPMLTEASEQATEPRAEAAIEPEVAQEPEVKTCTPDACFGAGANHVKACYEPANVPAQEKVSTTAEPEKAAWKITRGSARGLAVDDRRVTVETLKELRNFYLTNLDSSGPDFADFSDEKKDLLAGEMREVVGELRRRGIKD
jgi:hypothetical protein